MKIMIKKNIIIIEEYNEIGTITNELITVDNYIIKGYKLKIISLDNYYIKIQGFFNAVIIDEKM